MRLILTRHGETEENKAGILQGHIPGTLSSEGIEQAKRLALRLKDEKIDYIYASDLARAANTAKEIGRFHPDTPLIFVRELREGDLGSFSGKRKDEVDWNNRPADVETRQSMQDRSRLFLDKVYHDHPDASVLFVAHGGIISALITWILGKPVSHMDEMESLKNTSVSIFDIEEKGSHRMHIINCIRHLE